jgi:hypothetical protein
MVAFVRFGHRHEAKLSHTKARTERMPPFTSALRDEEHCAGLPLHYLFGAFPLGSNE